MNLHPRKTKDLIGHSQQIKIFKESYSSNKLHHAWLLEGPRGVGKATFAYNLSRSILSINLNNSPSLFNAEIETNKLQLQYNENSTIHKNVSENTHIDLKVIENDNNNSNPHLSEIITVEKVREAKAFFSKTSGEGGKRILILDSLDNLNLYGSNALLKIIEEPPNNSLIFLISNNKSNVLSTIRSRCRLLKFNNLSMEHTNKIITNSLINEIDEEQLIKLNILSNGAPGKGILFFENNGLEIYDYIIEIFNEFPNLNMENINKLYNLINSKSNTFNINILLELITIFIRRTIRKSFDILNENLTIEEENAQINLINNFSIEDISSLWDKTLKEINKTTFFNLDKKQTIVNIINNFKKFNSLSMEKN